ncbi:putative calcium-binding protein CML13 [Morus notabilis]|uniref:Putative calcium-binding protein CML13 n=2 Tax=Morus notabilis TaxID=981085 RepID=W9RYP5_9ROSA|nr:putative calcium-binding protein CML13 [Morus notabilis]
MGKDLSADQVSSMKEAFTLFDTDGDGRIAPSELGILMRSLGGNPTQAQLKSIIVEENLSAPFDFPRFLDLMAKHMKPEPFDRQLRDAFKVLDKDATGFVSVAELRHILTSIGEKLEPAEFDEWIREVDVGSDGKIRYEDFIARMVAKVGNMGHNTIRKRYEFCGLGLRKKMFGSESGRPEIDTKNMGQFRVRPT